MYGVVRLIQDNKYSYLHYVHTFHLQKNKSNMSYNHAVPLHDKHNPFITLNVQLPPTTPAPSVHRPSYNKEAFPSSDRRLITLFERLVGFNALVKTMMRVLFLFFVMTMWLQYVIAATAFARYREVRRSDSESLHALVFVIQPVNVELLESMLMERATLGSALYQQWLTFEEIGQLSSNAAGAAAVLNWLTERKLIIAWTSAQAEYIKAEATIGRWEELLGASFSQYEEKDVEKRTGRTHVIHRANEYTLPPHIQSHVHSVLNTIQEPLPIHRSPLRLAFPSQFGSSSENIVDIALLQKYYEIDSCSAGPSDPAIAHLQQAVVETADQRFSFEDIAMFQQMHHLPVRAPLDPYGYNTSQCRSTSPNPNLPSYIYEPTYGTKTSTYIYNHNPFTTLETVDYPCNEGNLNLQYLMAVAPCVETLFLYVAGDDPFVDWITSLADLVDPPKVFTVPWYSIEQVKSYGVWVRFQVFILKSYCYNFNCCFLHRLALPTQSMSSTERL